MNIPSSYFSQMHRDTCVQNLDLTVRWIRTRTRIGR
jgi:hypothetical protein